MNNNISFKVYFSEDNIRRFHCPSVPSWTDFMTLLSQNFSSFFQPQGHKIQYMDNEGDKIQVSSQFEWEEMFRQFSESQKLYKIYVSQSASQNCETVSPACGDDAKSPACGGRWRGGRGGWGSRGGCKKWYPYVLQGKGFRLLKEKRYKEASAMFKEQATLQPENPIPVYNTACAESLLGNTSESLIYLNKSVDLGYRDLHHMLKDEDLVPIRHTEGFNAVCLRLKDLLSALPVPQPEIPEVIPTPQPDPVVIPEPVPETPQVPVVIPELEPQPEPTSPWTTHLTLFHEMGYLNDELIVTFLEKYQGDVQRTIMALLESSSIF